MKTAICVITLALVLAVCMLGQTTTAEPEAQYSAAAGLGFNRYDTPQIKGWAAFETRVAAKTYSVSTLNMTSQVATISTGVKRVFYVSGPVSLFAAGDVGVATGEGSVTAALGGGGGIKLMLEGVAKKYPLLKLLGGVPGSYFSGALNVTQINGRGVLPMFSAGIGVDFR